MMIEIHENHERIAQLAAHHYCSAERGVRKQEIAARVKMDAEREGIIASDGAYHQAVEAIDAYEDVREAYK